MSLVVDEHRQYLADSARVSAFREAIAEVVKPGSVVLDLGSGTGILGLLACRAGARRVYSIEAGGMIELARSICRANGFADRVVFLKGHSSRVDLPERVDVVISDQIGRFGFEAGVLRYFEDARKRFLKPGGILIPSRIGMIVAAVEHPEVWKQIEFWNDSPGGFDFQQARTWAANTGYPVKFTPEQLLGEPAQLASIDLAVATATPFQAEAHLVASRAGTLHGIGGWFSAQLSASSAMTNSPLAAHPIERRNVFLPIDRPVPIAAGDCIRVWMSILPAEVMITWKVEVREKPALQPPAHTNGLKGRFTHSTLHGMLLSKEDLQRTQPAYVPRLNPWGEARLSVLRLCDGKRALSEIEKEILRLHPALFPSLDMAAQFVSEVVTRYSV
ncbi:MAG: class I SAM-dependent methyltransferase [Acidobacteria bacterium]|nr:class I SAM-dependent methyltransferase [Acidobacteriota bacterium]